MVHLFSSYLAGWRAFSWSVVCFHHHLLVFSLPSPFAFLHSQSQIGLLLPPSSVRYDTSNTDVATYSLTYLLTYSLTLPSDWASPSHLSVFSKSSDLPVLLLLLGCSLSRFLDLSFRTFCQKIERVESCFATTHCVLRSTFVCCCNQ